MGRGEGMKDEDLLRELCSDATPLLMLPRVRYGLRDNAGGRSKHKSSRARPRIHRSIKVLLSQIPIAWPQL